MNNLLSIVIVKILIFLRFFPGSLFLKNFQLLLSSFLINLKMAESFAHRPITLKSQQRPKSVFKLLNYTYLILTYILLTSTIREVRRSVRRISLLILGLQRLRSLWLKRFHIPIHTVLYRHSLQM